MRHRLACFSVIAIVVVCNLQVCAAGEGRTDGEPLWSVAVITDTQTPDRELTTALIDGLKQAGPDMVIHTGDTDFEWSNGFTLGAVADLVWSEPGGIEFHLAPGNHDLRGGALKAHLRQAATQGTFGIGRYAALSNQKYSGARPAVYITGAALPAWNPEIASHPAWQAETNVKFADWGDSSESCRYVFKRGGIRFIVCDWSYSNDQREWLRKVIMQPDDSSVSIVLHHAHFMSKLTRYFEGLEGRHNVKLVLSGHDHRYWHESRDGITYIAGAGIARSGRDCDVMMLQVYEDHLRLDRCVIPDGSRRAIVRAPEPIWTCEGNFSEYRRPQLPEQRPAYVKDSGLAYGVFYEQSK